MTEESQLITAEEIKRLHGQRPDLTPDQLLHGLQMLDYLSVPEETGLPLYDCFRLLTEVNEILGNGGEISDLNTDQSKVNDYMTFAVTRIDEFVSEVNNEP